MEPIFETVKIVTLSPLADEEALLMVEEYDAIEYRLWKRAVADRPGQTRVASPMPLDVYLAQGALPARPRPVMVHTLGRFPEGVAWSIWSEGQAYLPDSREPLFADDILEIRSRLPV